MNKNLKLKLIRKFPILFSKEISAMTREYNSSELDRNLDDWEKPIDKIELEDVLSIDFTKEFADLLLHRYFCRLRLDPKTPLSLRENPEYIDWIANNNPSCIIYIQDNMMKPEYVTKYEKYLNDNPSGIISYSLKNIKVSKKILDLEIFVDRIVKELRDNDIYDIPDIINNFSSNPQALDKIINVVKPKQLAEDYRRFNYAVQSNEILLKKVLNYSIVTFMDVPKEKESFAKNYLIERINSNNFKIKDILYQIYHTQRYGLVFFDNDFASAILNQYYTYHLDNDEETKVTLELLASSFFDMKNFSTSDKYRLYIIGAKNTNTFSWVSIKEALSNDKELLLYFIEIGDNRYILNFTSDVIEECLTAIIRKYKENPDNFNLYYILHRLQNRKITTKILLEESIRDENFFYNIIDLLEDFYFAFKDKETFLLTIELLKQNYDIEKLKKFVVDFYANEPDFLSAIIDNELFQYVKCFNDRAMTPQLIPKLLLHIPICELNKSTLEIENNLEIKNIEEFNKIVALNINDNNIITKLIFLSYAKKNNIESPYLEQFNSDIEKLKQNASPEYRLAIDKILNGERKVQSYEFIISNKSLRYFNRIGDILDIGFYEYIECLPDEIIDNINIKHVREIQKYVGKVEEKNSISLKLGLQIYASLGFEKAKELLTGVYGPININQLDIMFGNISLLDIVFKKDGNSTVPILNDKLINLIFGANKNVKNTPIRNYLNDYAEKKDELNKKREEIRKSSLDEAAKELGLNNVDEEEKKYIKDTDDFMVNLSQVFNDWDIYEEEFLKAQSKEKLKIKLNINRINKISKYVRIKRKSPELEARDQELKESDVFEYVGVDTQYTSHIETVIPRTIELSRGMENITTKKFPDVQISKYGLKIGIYNPQDRNILSAGYKSGCCFRPNGNADNYGNNNSLLKYCTGTTYGGGLYVTDEKGDILMFSPILRNGNVLMIHSFETKGTKGKIEDINKLLIEFAEETIKKANESGDDISFVTMTTLHGRLDLNLTKGLLPTTQKFRVYDENGTFERMYNNLNMDHAILASKEGAKLEDIHYGPVAFDYQYETKNIVYSIDLNQDLITTIKKLELLKDKIIMLSNQKEISRTKNDYNSVYQLKKEIKEIKKEYLIIYKKILDGNKGRDIFEEYKRNKSIVSEICKTNKTIIPKDIKRCICGKGWYIIITEKGEIIGDCLEFARREYERMFKNTLDLYTDLIPYPNGLKETSDLETKPIGDTI